MTTYTTLCPSLSHAPLLPVSLGLYHCELLWHHLLWHHHLLRHCLLLLHHWLLLQHWLLLLLHACTKLLHRLLLNVAPWLVALLVPIRLHLVPILLLLVPIFLLAFCFDA